MCGATRHVLRRNRNPPQTLWLPLLRGKAPGLSCPQPSEPGLCEIPSISKHVIVLFTYLSYLTLFQSYSYETPAIWSLQLYKFWTWIME